MCLHIVVKVINAHETGNKDWNAIEDFLEKGKLQNIQEYFHVNTLPQ